MSRWGFRQEFGRKIIHLFSISFLIIYLIFSNVFDEKIALIILAAILVVMIHLEFWRLETKISFPILNMLWKYKRPKEKGQLGGEVFFLIGAIICLAIFDIRIAAGAILMATFGDMAAAIVGKGFGKNWITKRKAWEGIIAEFIIDILVGFLVIRTTVWKLSGHLDFGQSIWLIIIIMAFTATFVETVASKIDDNLLVPVLAGFNGQVALMLMMYLGWL